MRKCTHLKALVALCWAACLIFFMGSRVEAQRIYLDPATKVDECLNVDTLWVWFDAQVQDLEAAHIKLSYDHTHLIPTAVIANPAIAANLFVDSTIYPDDSIIINVGVLSGHFDGPGPLVGVVLTVGINIVTTPVNIVQSILRDSENHDIPHAAYGAAVQTGCCCRFQGDLDSNGILSNLQDVVLLVEYVFRQGAMPVVDPGCPTHRGELNCDDIPDVRDVVRLVEVAFRSGDPKIWICDPCRCAPYPSHCP